MSVVNLYIHAHTLRVYIISVVASCLFSGTRHRAELRGISWHLPQLDRVTNRADLSSIEKRFSLMR